MKRIHRSLQRLHRDDRGAMTSEYMLILALVVLPIALMTPLFYYMIRAYTARLTNGISLPFP